MIFLSDIHGFYPTVVNILQQLGSKNIKDTSIIQLGDFGYHLKWMGETGLDQIEKYCEKYNYTFYLIRGNHDDPKFYDGTWTRKHIQFVKDYTVLNIENKNILCIGGGISIDRKDLIEGIRYFPDEVLVVKEEILDKLRNIDYVATHVAPDFVMPFTLSKLVESFAEFDKTLKDELKSEREKMTSIFYMISKHNAIKKWYYGHYHFGFQQSVGNTEFILIAAEKYEII
jgi:predicted phosphodiesterase